MRTSHVVYDLLHIQIFNWPCLKPGRAILSLVPRKHSLLSLIGDSFTWFSRLLDWVKIKAFLEAWHIMSMNRLHRFLFLLRLILVGLILSRTDCNCKWTTLLYSCKEVNGWKILRPQTYTSAFFSLLFLVGLILLRLNTAPIAIAKRTLLSSYQQNNSI